MHDLILRNRVEAYGRDDLLKTLYTKGRRQFFEHYIPGHGVLVALPVDDYRFLLPRMKERRKGAGWGGTMTPEEKRLAPRILSRIREEGPLGAADFADERRSTSAWGIQNSLAKNTLDKLFFHGRLFITRRESFRRIYDLPERVMPEDILKARPATAKQLHQWKILSRLKQRRLATLTNAEIKLVTDHVTKITVPDHPATYCLNEDAHLLEAATNDLPAHQSDPLLLGPLDPVIYDRKLTRRLWDFDYTWEVYTPEAKRTRGYYALPVLVGTKIVGHVDPKADRPTNTLNVKIDVPKGVNVSNALKSLTAFLGLKSFNITKP